MLHLLWYSNSELSLSSHLLALQTLYVIDTIHTQKISSLGGENINLKQEIQIKLFSIPNTFERLPIWRYIQNYHPKKSYYLIAQHHLFILFG